MHDQKYLADLLASACPNYENDSEWILCLIFLNKALHHSRSTCTKLQHFKRVVFFVSISLYVYVCKSCFFVYQTFFLLVHTRVQFLLAALLRLLGTACLIDEGPSYISANWVWHKGAFWANDFSLPTMWRSQNVTDVSHFRVSQSPWKMKWILHTWRTYLTL